MGRQDRPSRLIGTGTGPGALGPHLHPQLVRAVGGVLDGVAARGVRAVVAVSGGPDSVALLHLLVAARPDLDVVVAHVRHGLRDDAADAACAAAHAAHLGCDHRERDVEVAQGEGPEDAARRARHRALAQVCDEVGSGLLLLGHTADDQAETVLLRMARGTGIDGLSGMAPIARRGPTTLVRPMLGLRRADVRSVVADLHVVADPTNRDPDQRRARARAEALPALGRLRPDGGDAVPALCRLADLARRDARALRAVERQSPPVRYGPAVLVARHVRGPLADPAVQSRLLRAGWAQLPGRPPAPPARAVDAAVALPHGRRADLAGGVVVTASAHGWVLCPATEVVLPARPLPLGGAVAVPEHALHVRAEVATAPGREDAVADVTWWQRPPPWRVHIGLPAGPPVGLCLTGRDREGARDVRPLLQGVPAGLRGLVPLLVDAGGRTLSAGPRPVVPAEPGAPCLLLAAEPLAGQVGYPAGP